VSVQWGTIGLLIIIVIAVISKKKQILVHGCLVDNDCNDDDDLAP